MPKRRKDCSPETRTGISKSEIGFTAMMFEMINTEIANAVITTNLPGKLHCYLYSTKTELSLFCH